MTKSDQVRQHVIATVSEPARRAGRPGFSVRAGDVHKAMGFSNAMPLVCSAIGSKKLAHAAAARLVHRSGPTAGASVVFEFTFADRNGESPPAQTTNPVSVSQAEKPEARGAAVAATPAEADFTEGLTLVACVKSKRLAAAPARQLYTSPLFLGARDYIEAREAPWYILSALHGLVHPDEVIAPYDCTLKGQDASARRDWSARVLDRLLPIARGHRRIIFFAGARYREFLVAPLRRAGYEVLIPLGHLRQGEQLAWYARKR